MEPLAESLQASQHGDHAEAECLLRQALCEGPAALATARLHQATHWTPDAHVERLVGVKFVKKR